MIIPISIVVVVVALVLVLLYSTLVIAGRADDAYEKERERRMKANEDY